MSPRRTSSNHNRRVSQSRSIPSADSTPKNEPYRVIELGDFHRPLSVPRGNKGGDHAAIDQALRAEGRAFAEEVIRPAFELEAKSGTIIRTKKQGSKKDGCGRSPPCGIRLDLEDYIPVPVDGQEWKYSYFALQINNPTDRASTLPRKWHKYAPGTVAVAYVLLTPENDKLGYNFEDLLARFAETFDANLWKSESPMDRVKERRKELNLPMTPQQLPLD